MDKSRKATIATFLIFFVFCNLVTISEIPLVARDKVVLFATLKLFIVGMFLPFAWCIWKNYHTKKVIIMAGVLMMAYAVVGQLFRPLYYLAFFQGSFLYAVVLPVSRKVFRTTMLIGSSLFLFVLYLKWDQFIEQSKHPVFSDMAFGVFAVAIIAMIANTFFSSERSFHEDAVARFSQIGIHSARVIHDLKGLIAAPKLHVQLLQSRMSNSVVDQETQEILELISNDLDGLKQVLVELNLLSNQDASYVEWVDLNDIFKSVQKLLSKQLQGVEVIAQSSIRLNTDRSVLTSMLVNLVLNSVQTFKERGTSHPRIELSAEDQSIFIRDNAEGFQAGILESFLKDQFYSTREGGSGLGIMLTAHGMKSLKGKMLLSNSDTGAQVELKFPPRLVKKLNSSPSRSGFEVRT